MANEAVCIEAPTLFRRYKVIDEVQIPKGTILRISSGDLYAAPSSTGTDKFAGIAIEEKTASDGITEIGVALNGTWDLKGAAVATITLGTMVCLSGANLIRSAVEADFPLGCVLGKALEAGSADEVIRVRVGGCVN